MDIALWDGIVSRGARPGVQGDTGPKKETSRPIRTDDRVTSDRTRVQSRAAPSAVRIIDQPSCAADVLFENEHMSASDSNLVGARLRTRKPQPIG
jgi:hypothetical protein